MPRKKKDVVDDIMKMIDDEIPGCNSHEDISHLADKIMEKLARESGSDMAGKSFDEYMNKPILKVTYTRKGTKIEGGQLFGFELVEGAKNMIHSILEMVPSKHRLNVIGDVISNMNMDDENSVKPEEEED